MPQTGHRTGIYHAGWIGFNKNARRDVYEDPRAPAERRIEDLLAQMSLEEKTPPKSLPNNSLTNSGTACRSSTWPFRVCK